MREVRNLERQSGCGGPSMLEYYINGPNDGGTEDIGLALVWAEE